MDEQLVSIRGIYRDGLIELTSPYQPRGKFRVIVTFLESENDPEASQREKARIAASLKLTTREVEILELLQQGLSNRAIAEQLEIGDGTVRNYVSSILAKLGAVNRTQGVTKAISVGLLD